MTYIQQLGQSEVATCSPGDQLPPVPDRVIAKCTSRALPEVVGEGTRISSFLTYEAITVYENI